MVHSMDNRSQRPRLDHAVLQPVNTHVPSGLRSAVKILRGAASVVKPAPVCEVTQAVPSSDQVRIRRPFGLNRARRRAFVPDRPGNGRRDFTSTPSLTGRRRQ
jgi:hypothetical protein